MDKNLPDQVLSKGTKFSSFKDLSEAIEKWEATNFVQLYKRSSRSIEATTKRAPNRRYNLNLKYSEIDYACIHGGRKANTSTSTGKRPNQR